MTAFCPNCAKPISDPCPVGTIIRAVSSHYGIGTVDLLSERRHRDYARPRQVAMYLAKSLTLQSLPQIGKRFHRDHTTVIHAVRRIEALKASDPVLAGDVARLQNFLSGWIV